MVNEHSSLRQFGKCRLDVEKKLLWFGGSPVQVPPKAVELLCLLVERRGEVVTKDEIWHNVWHDAFVEETNLTHNIYLLRKALKDLGEDDVIATIPRRGYRFTAHVHDLPVGDVVIERHALTRTLIEIENVGGEPAMAEKKPFVLRNAGRAVALVVIAAAAVALTATAYRNWTTPKPGVRSLGVLPFREIGAHAESEHQGVGIADLLITRLSRIKGLNVRPSGAVVKFEGTQTASTEIGKELQVDTVLEGSVYQTDKNVRLTARLLSVADGSVIWSGEFEKRNDQALRLQDELALQIVNALSLNISSDKQRYVAANFTENADALDLYVKGRYEWNRRSWAGMIEAERLFRSAIARDPDFTIAYVGLADKLAMGSAPQEAELVIAKALELDPNSSEAHATKGFIDMFHEWKWKEAEEELGRSIELNPGYASAHQWLGVLYGIEGKNEDGIRELRRAVEIDPTSPNFEADLGQAYYFDHHYDLAKYHCLKALEADPDFGFAHTYLWNIDLVTGDFKSAIDEWEISSRRILEYPTQPDAEKGLVAERFAASSAHFRNAPPSEFLDAAADRGNGSPEECFGSARINAFKGDNETALTDLTCAAESKNFGVAFVKADPMFDGLRDDPRYKEILNKMNLPE